MYFDRVTLSKNIISLPIREKLAKMTGIQANKAKFGFLFFFMVENKQTNEWTFLFLSLSNVLKERKWE